MPIDLTQFERGAPFDGDFATALAVLDERLRDLQLAQRVHGKRAIILFEGWDGAGKKDALRRLAAAWDPCLYRVHAILAPDDGEAGPHWMARFWACLPPVGDSAIFYRSWYRQALDARVQGRLGDKQWTRAADEINEFEAQQRDHGTLIVKLFFHVSAALQAERLREAGEHRWRRWLITPEELRGHALRDRSQPAAEERVAATDTRWAPWRPIDAGDRQAAEIAALEAIAEALAAHVPKQPPAEDPRIVMLAQHQAG